MRVYEIIAIKEVIMGLRKLITNHFLIFLIFYSINIFTPYFSN